MPGACWKMEAAGRCNRIASARQDRTGGHPRPSSGGQPAASPACRAIEAVTLPADTVPCMSDLPPAGGSGPADAPAAQPGSGRGEPPAGSRRGSRVNSWIGCHPGRRVVPHCPDPGNDQEFHTRLWLAPSLAPTGPMAAMSTPAMHATLNPYSVGTLRRWWCV